MALDLSNLSPEDIKSLREALGMPTDNQGRSPEFGNRQLHDLRLLPTATDPRPTFFFSADAPRDGGEHTKTRPYPRLMWTSDGVEITVRSAKEQADKEALGYLLTDPGTATEDPTAAIRAAFAKLSPEDQALILESQKRARLGKLEEKMANLSDEDLATFDRPKRK